MCCSVGENGRHFVEFISSFIFSRCPLLKRPPLPLHASGEVKISTKSGENLNKYLKQIQTAALSSPDAPHPHPTAWENEGKTEKLRSVWQNQRQGGKRSTTHLCKVYLLWLLITMLISGTWFAWIMGDQNFSKYYIDPLPPTQPLNCTTTLGERSAAALRDDVWEGGRRRRKCFG